MVLFDHLGCLRCVFLDYYLHFMVLFGFWLSRLSLVGSYITSSPILSVPFLSLSIYLSIYLSLHLSISLYVFFFLLLVFSRFFSTYQIICRFCLVATCFTLVCLGDTRTLRRFCESSTILGSPTTARGRSKRIIGSVTSLWPGLSVFRSVGWLVGLSHFLQGSSYRGNYLPLPCVA